MPKKKYNVTLSPAEESFLKSIIHKGKNHSAREIIHAQVLLHSNDNRPQDKKDNRVLAEWLGISPTTANQIRKSYATDGLEAALYRKTRISPAGRFKKYWCIPKQNDAAFAANMEDVLGIYQLPCRKDVPVICMDEKPLQPLGEIRGRISAAPIHTDPDTKLPKPGYCEKVDSGYVRCGTASIFMFAEPLGGWRHVPALEHRTKVDYAKMMLRVAEECYADCDKVILISGNLNTHNKASFI